MTMVSGKHNDCNKMGKFNLPKIKSREEQIAEVRKILSEDRLLINKEWALAQFDQNPNVEFEKWAVVHFYNYIFSRSAECYDVACGDYYFLTLKGGESPKFIINGEEW